MAATRNVRLQAARQIAAIKNALASSNSAVFSDARRLRARASSAIDDDRSGSGNSRAPKRRSLCFFLHVCADFSTCEFIARVYRSSFKLCVCVIFSVLFMPPNEAMLRAANDSTPRRRPISELRPAPPPLPSAIATSPPKKPTHRSVPTFVDASPRRPAAIRSPTRDHKRDLRLLRIKLDEIKVQMIE